MKKSTGGLGTIGQCSRCGPRVQSNLGSSAVYHSDHSNALLPEPDRGGTGGRQLLLGVPSIQCTARMPVHKLIRLLARKADLSDSSCTNFPMNDQAPNGKTGGDNSPGSILGARATESAPRQAVFP